MKTRIAGALLLTVLMAAAFGAQAADSPLAPFHADYHFDRKGLGSGHSVFTLQKGTDGSYVYKSELHPSGLAALLVSLITQTSTFQVVDGRPRAGSYDYVQTGGQKASETVKFDWEKKAGTTEEDGKTHKAALTPDVADVQLIQLILATDVAAGKVAGSYKILDHGDISTYTTKSLPDSKFAVGGKDYATKVVALTDASKNRTITAWMAPDLHYLPVQIQQVDSRNTITLTMQDVSFNGVAPAAASKSGG